MARKPKKKCEHHGILRDSNANYCPICGGEATSLPLYPFRFYFSKSGLIWLGGLVAVSCLLIYLILNVKGCHQRMVLKQQYYQEQLAQQTEANKPIIEALSDDWKMLYLGLVEIKYDYYRKDALRDFLKSRKDIDPLPSDAINLFVRLFRGNNYREEVFTALTRVGNK